MKLLRILIYCVITVIVLYLAINLSICILFGGTKVEYIPEKGIWFCEELKLQLSFEEGYDCYYVLDGAKIRCIWENNPGSRVITVLCQDDNTYTYSIGEVIFWGTCIELTEDQFIIEEKESGIPYVFLCKTGDSPLP